MCGKVLGPMQRIRDNGVNANQAPSEGRRGSANVLNIATEENYGTACSRAQRHEQNIYGPGGKNGNKTI